jgi:hypothetical protein
MESLAGASIEAGIRLLDQRLLEPIQRHGSIRGAESRRESVAAELPRVPSVVEGAHELAEEVPAREIATLFRFTEAIPVELRHQTAGIGVRRIVAQGGGERHHHFGRRLGESGSKTRHFVLGFEERRFLLDTLPIVVAVSEVLDLAPGFLDLLL